MAIVMMANMRRVMPYQWYTVIGNLDAVALTMEYFKWIYGTAQTVVNHADIKPNIVLIAEQRWMRMVILIKSMEEFIDERFEGTTKKEASEYISRNMQMYKLLTLDSWTLGYGEF